MYHDATTQLHRQFYYMQKFESAWVDTKNFRWIYFKWTIYETANLASNPNISSFPRVSRKCKKFKKSSSTGLFWLFGHRQWWNEQKKFWVHPLGWSKSSEVLCSSVWSKWLWKKCLGLKTVLPNLKMAWDSTYIYHNVTLNQIFK